MRRVRNSVLLPTWLDAQPHPEVIVHQAQQQIALRAAVGLAAIQVATGHIHPSPILRLGAAEAVKAAIAAVPAAASGQDGLVLVRPLPIQLQKCGHLRRSARPSKSNRSNPIFGTSFYATRGTIVRGPAKELHDQLEARRVSVWFSEKDVVLGTSLLREIDKGLAKSRVGVVLVTPALLRRVDAEGIAEKELSVLLARDLLVPIVHNTTYEALRDVSPMLGSRSGLSTAENLMAEIAAKLAELVAI